MIRHSLSAMLCRIWFALATALVVADAGAHGSVVPEEDLCLVQIGYLRAHFKIYLPRTHGHEEFCEDVPEVTESVFVMEYVHRGLADMPVDFRIIRDVPGVGRFAKWEHVAEIEDLESATVFYKPPSIEPDVFTIIKEFDEPGWYIGIVNALPPETGKTYTAVFPFKVGFLGFGYWPYMIGIMMLLQLLYWYTSGSFGYLRQWRKKRVIAIGLTVLLSANAVAEESWTSKTGHFRVTYSSQLEPVVINKIHNWVLHVETDNGAPVANAVIAVQGGMPEHDHGLPTGPRVTRYLGDGDYLIEGLRFHMNGLWEITISIEADDYRDDVIIPLEL